MEKTEKEVQPSASEEEKREREEAQPKRTVFTGRYIAKVALFSAMAGFLYLIPGIPLGFFASWLELRFYDIPTIIGTYALGPLAGSVIVAVRFVLKIATVGTSSGYIGELGDLLCGFAMVLPIGFLYKYKRNFKWAVLSLLIGSVASVLVAVVINRFLLVPYYANLTFIGGMPGLTQQLSVLYPGITAENFYTYYLLLSVVPFNLMRCAIAAAVTLPLYKRISRLLKKF